MYLMAVPTPSSKVPGAHPTLEVQVVLFIEWPGPYELQSMLWIAGPYQGWTWHSMASTRSCYHIHAFGLTRNVDHSSCEIGAAQHGRQDVESVQRDGASLGSAARVPPTSLDGSRGPCVHVLVQ